MEPFENDKNQNTEHIMAENMTSAPAKRYEGKSFIFSDIPSQEKIIQVLCTTFGLDPEGMGDTLVLHNGDIEIRLAVASESAGEKAEEFIKRQVEGTCDHFYQVKTGVVDVKTNLLYQIGRARSFVLVEYAFDVEDEEDIEGKKTMIEDMFVSVLNDLEGIILIQNQEEKEDSMFCCGENGEKLLILSDKGGSAFTRYLPYQEPDLKAGKDITQEQVDRRMRTMQTLIGNAIYVPGWLPAVEPASQITCPSLEETAKRALAIMGVAIYSECLLDEKQGVEKAQNFLMDYIDNNNTQDYFSPREWRYLHDTAPDRKEVLSFLRQYESLYVVEWALGLVEELGFPDHPCNPADLVKSLRNGTSISKIMAKSRPKSPRELLDACDLISCLEWSCINARRHELPEPAGMKTGAVREWHKALNWLTGHGQWDEVRANS